MDEITSHQTEVSKYNKDEDENYYMEGTEGRIGKEKKLKYFLSQKRDLLT